MQNRGITLAVAAALITAVACAADEPAPLTTVPNTNIVTFKATMNGANEVPAITTPGTGTFTATLDTVTNILTYDLTFTGLTAGVNNGHIHGPATTLVASGTTVNFNTLAGATYGFGLTAGAGHGIVALTATNAITATMSGDSLKKLLFLGLTYVNIHTTLNPGGEIRGQLTKQ